MAKVAIILSSKSSGSSALQKYLIKVFGFQSARLTGHHEAETLFCTKAASTLDMPQDPLFRSLVPLNKGESIIRLRNLLLNNGVSRPPSEWTKNQIFNAFTEMALRHQVFVEKSPHHLYNVSNLKLIRNYLDVTNDIEFLVIGLVRNPMDTIFSAWERWRFNCNSFEREWTRSYQNLLALRKWPELVIIRYEDLIKSTTKIDMALQAMGLQPLPNANFNWKQSSIRKWKTSKVFGHTIRNDTIEVAQAFGYADTEVQNSSSVRWSLISGYYQLKSSFREFSKKLEP